MERGQMTVKDLKDILEDIPEDYVIFQNDAEFGELPTLTTIVNNDEKRVIMEME